MKDKIRISKYMAFLLRYNPKATEAGKRRTPKPVILEIDARQAMEEGIKIEKASEKVFIADYIPRKFIKRIG